MYVEICPFFGWADFIVQNCSIVKSRTRRGDEKGFDDRRVYSGVGSRLGGGDKLYGVGSRHRGARHNFVRYHSFVTFRSTVFIRVERAARRSKPHSASRRRSLRTRNRRLGNIAGLRSFWQRGITLSKGGPSGFTSPGHYYADCVKAKDGTSLIHWKFYVGPKEDSRANSFSSLHMRSNLDAKPCIDKFGVAAYVTKVACYITKPEDRFKQYDS